MSGSDAADEPPEADRGVGAADVIEAVLFYYLLRGALASARLSSGLPRPQVPPGVRLPDPLVLPLVGGVAPRGVTLPNPFGAPPELRAVAGVSAWLRRECGADPRGVEIAAVTPVAGGHLVEASIPRGPFRQRFVGRVDASGRLLDCRAEALDRTRR